MISHLLEGEGQAAEPDSKPTKANRHLFSSALAHAPKRVISSPLLLQKEPLQSKIFEGGEVSEMGRPWEPSQI